jgi:UDP-N-acetylglucosamine--N-acetylmuramyl-(pentapeptide) pyrophosphoryl-undecaprenol N-acetylglucosamine transferase
MKVLISGGGTAGHIYPGLALAEVLKAADSRIEPIFVGTAGGLETKLIPKAGYELITVPVISFSRSLNWRSLIFATKLSAGILKSARILQRLRPAVVVGMGGYASFPLVLAATWQGYPCLIHEQNSIPGLANKVLAKKVKVVATSFAITKEYFKEAKKVVLVGNPVRPQVLKATLSEAEQTLGLKKEKGKTYLLVFGGSQGASSINEVAFNLVKQGLLAGNITLIHLTGQTEAEKYQQLKKKLPSQQQKQYHPLAYLDNIGLAYRLADIVVCRAGASSIAEVTAVGLPSILVPYPYATDNHQLKNAEVLTALGAARLILNENLSVATLVREIKEISKPEILTKMQAAAKAFGQPQAGVALAKEVINLAKMEL